MGDDGVYVRVEDGADKNWQIEKYLGENCKD